MDQHQFNQALIEFLASSPTPFHAVAQMASTAVETQALSAWTKPMRGGSYQGAAIGSAAMTRPLLPGGCRRAAPWPRVAFAWSVPIRIRRA